MDIRNNYLTAPNTNHPNNTVWNPAIHASLLAPFMRTPPAAAVGIGFANWNPLTVPSLSNGVPIRLSTYTTNVVSVDYSIQTPGATLTQGTLTFQPGETVKHIVANTSGVSTQDLVLVALSNPVACEFTAGSQLLIVPADPSANTNVALMSFGSAWQYLDNGSDQGTAWRAPAFNDSGWSNGLAQLGYGDSPRDEVTLIRRTSASGTTNITFYFRKAVEVADPGQFVSLRMRLLRDDAGVVYLNGNEVYRSPNLPAFPTAINYLTRATTTGENSIDMATLSATNLISGTNLIAVEIHQESTTSSDVSFDFELSGNLPAGRPRLNLAQFGDDLVLYWSNPSYVLEASEALGAGANWTAVAGASSPVTVASAGTRRFYRLRQ